MLESLLFLCQTNQIVLLFYKKRVYILVFFFFDLKWCFFKSMFSISLDVIIIIESCKI